MEEEKEELDLLREKIAVARQQGEDLEPERKSLGFALKNIYENCLHENKNQQSFQVECAQKAGKEAEKEAKIA